MVLNPPAIDTIVSAFVKGTMHPRHIQVLMDNSTAVSHINKRGGTHSPTLACLALEIWNFCISRQILITARHVPGVTNTGADFASKNFVFNNRTDSEQESTPDDNQEVLHPRGGSICISNQQPATTLCGKIPRPRVSSNRCFSPALGTVDGVHTRSNSALATDSAEITTGSSNGTGDSPNLARTAMVPSPPGATGGFSSSVTDSGGNNLLTVRTTSNTSNVQNPPTSCMAAVRSRLQTTGLSPEVCKILLASWRTSTQKRYEGPWQQWASWFLERNKCTFSAPVADVLDFLSEQFNDRNLAYRKVGVYKACTSQMHDPVDGLQLGSLPLVSRFMKGIFQLRPATPRICTTWQVGPVLRYLSSLEPVQQLSLKVLSLKLTTGIDLSRKGSWNCGPSPWSSFKESRQLWVHYSHSRNKFEAISSSSEDIPRTLSTRLLHLCCEVFGTLSPTHQ
jgi:hypothetical protein